MKGKPITLERWIEACNSISACQFNDVILTTLWQYYEVTNFTTVDMDDPKQWKPAIKAMLDKWEEYSSYGLWREFAGQYFKEYTWDVLEDMFKDGDEVKILIGKMTKYVVLQTLNDTFLVMKR